MATTKDLSWTMSIDEFLDELGKRLTALLVADRSDPHKLSIGFLGGDIPIRPPFAILWLTFFWCLTWFDSPRRLRFVPKPLRQSLKLRLAVCGVMVGYAIQLTISAMAELERVGTHPNFQQVPMVADQGPYAWTRNSLYISALICQFSLAVACDSGWLLFSAIMTFVYLDKIVIPAEEEFLARELVSSSPSDTT